jgi:RNA-binding protein
MTMELLGEILHFSRSGRIIVKIDQNRKNPRAGLLVFNNEKKIGKIVELIGSVKSPYASIIPFIQPRSKTSGMKVYTNPTNNKARTIRTRNYIKRNKK